MYGPHKSCISYLYGVLRTSYSTKFFGRPGRQGRQGSFTNSSNVSAKGYLLVDPISALIAHKVYENIQFSSDSDAAFLQGQTLRSIYNTTSPICKAYYAGGCSSSLFEGTWDVSLTHRDRAQTTDAQGVGDHVGTCRANWDRLMWAPIMCEELSDG